MSFTGSLSTHWALGMRSSIGGASTSFDLKYRGQRITDSAAFGSTLSEVRGCPWRTAFSCTYHLS
jgi:hypothetical protein